VSVIMTIYNAAPYLRSAIDSVAAQTYSSWELIAVENGSTDASPAILAAYDDPRIRALALPRNIGRTPALQYALERTTGDYVAVLDADDLARADRFERQVAFLQGHPDVGVVGAWSREIDADGTLVGEIVTPTEHAELIDRLGWSNPFVHSTVMFRADLARDLGGYPQEIGYAQDYAFLLRVAAVSQLHIIDDFLSQMRTAPTSMSFDPALRLVRAEEELLLLRAAAATLPLSRFAVRLNRHRQAVARLKIGLSMARARRLGRAAAHLVPVVLLHPRALVDNGYVHRRMRAFR
jgi:glycosyltransferase involved in cell wall biosynthesis